MVDLFQRTWRWDLTINPPDQRPRGQGIRCSDTYPLFAEPVAAREQASARENGFSVLITPYLQHIETLDVRYLSGIGQLTQALPDFPRSLPNLRSLTLSTTSILNLDESVDPFGSLTPTLKRLSLLGMPFYPSFHRLRALTSLTLLSFRFNLHLDTLLDFMEENRSLDTADLGISFNGPSLWSLRRRTTIRNRLQRLLIHWWCETSARLLISSIPLQKGADLKILN